MSVHFSSAVWSARIGDPVAKIVLLKLADNANDAGKCWPSIATVSAETELCERTVQSKIRALENAGLLISTRGRNRCDYALLIDEIKKLTPQEMHPAGDAPRRRCTPQEMQVGVQEMRGGVQDVQFGGAGRAVASGEPSRNRQGTVREPSGGGQQKTINEFDIEEDFPKPLCTLKQAKSYAPTYGLSDQEAEFWWHTRNKAGWTCGTYGGTPRKITSAMSDMATSVSWIRESMARAKLTAANGHTPKKFID